MTATPGSVFSYVATVSMPSMLVWSSQVSG